MKTKPTAKAASTKKTAVKSAPAKKSCACKGKRVGKCKK